MSEKKPDDLARAREFLAEVSKAVDVSPEIIDNVMPHLLGLTKHVAHDAVRPAAPLSAFLVGIASAGQSSQEVKANIEKVEAVVAHWREEHDGETE